MSIEFAIELFEMVSIRYEPLFTRYRSTHVKTFCPKFARHSNSWRQLGQPVESNRNSPSKHISKHSPGSVHHSVKAIRLGLMRERESWLNLEGSGERSLKQLGLSVAGVSSK